MWKSSNNRLRLNSGARAIQRGIADIGGEYLNGPGIRRRRDVSVVGADVFQERDGHGVGFFAGGATGNPNADGPVGRLAVFYECRKNLLAQGIEGNRVAKEASDMN